MKRYRSSYWRCSVRKYVLRNFSKFTGKHQSLFFNKVAGLRPATLLKKRLWHRCFPVSFVKFLRTPFLQNIFGRLLLKILTLSIVFVCRKRIFRNNLIIAVFTRSWKLGTLNLTLWIYHPYGVLILGVYDERHIRSSHQRCSIKKIS